MKNKINSVKRIAAVLLACVSVFLVSCKKNVVVNPTETTPSTTAMPTRPPQPEATNTETIATDIVYNANGITVKAEALDFSDSQKVRVKFRITNESQYDLKVMVPKDSDGMNTILVNGKKVQANLVKTLQKPQTVAWLDVYWHQLRDEYQIETIDEIELKLVFVEAYVQDPTPLYMTDTIKISTKKAND